VTSVLHRYRHLIGLATLAVGVLEIALDTYGPRAITRDAVLYSLTVIGIVLYGYAVGTARVLIPATAAFVLALVALTFVDASLSADAASSVSPIVLLFAAPMVWLLLLFGVGIRDSLPISHGPSDPPERVSRP
jgi:hypothetical protein